jgi:hypothetical protein
LAGVTRIEIGVILNSDPAAGGTSESVEVPLRPDGTFEFHNIPPGNYRMQASPIVMPEGNRASLSGRLPITVGTQDVFGIDLPRSIFCNCNF